MKEPKLLSSNARRLLAQILRAVLSSTRELVADTGLSPDQGKRGLRELAEAEMTSSAEVGGVLTPVPRHWATEKGLDEGQATDEQRDWHGDAGVVNLLTYDSAKLEGVHPIARQFATGGWTVSGIHPFEREPMAAAVEYSHPDESVPAYLVVCCPSMMETEADLTYRIEAIPSAMQSYSKDPDRTFYPSGFAIIAATEWGAARPLDLATALLSEWLPPTTITAWYHDGDDWRFSTGASVLNGVPPTRVHKLLPPISSLHPPGSIRKLGKRTLKGVLSRFCRLGRGWRQQLELLTLVAVYPVGAVAHYQGLAGENPADHETRDRMRALRTLQMVRVATEKGRAPRPRGLAKDVPTTLSGRGQGADRYTPTTLGNAFVCFVHGGRPSDLSKRTKLGRLTAWMHDGTCDGKCDRTCDGREVDRWPYRHEDILYETLGQFVSMGCRIDPGWQARTTLANGQRIDPDGIILVVGPWGLEWYALEIELSDRTYGAAKPRCEKYASDDRMEDGPVLVVCHDEEAERNWQRAGAECARPPAMLTTTLRRLKDGGVAGPEVWSHYGLPVTLTA